VPNKPGDEVAGAARDDPRRQPGAGERADHLHRGAVAADDEQRGRPGRRAARRRAAGA
jgi:hypothetical protein